MTNIRRNLRQPAARTISRRTLIAYRGTRYQAGGIEVRIGRRSFAMDRLLSVNRAREAVFITAYNPFSRVMPPGWNRRMQARLRDWLRRRAFVGAHGALRRWSEAHLLVFGDVRPMLRLARRFRQLAVVVVRIGRTARLLITA